jgi:hypothetical protein
MFTSGRACSLSLTSLATGYLLPPLARLIE